MFGLAAFIQVTQGAITAAIGTVIFGLCVLAVADHVIRPLLIGGATRLPFIWVLFGILGLFLGPALMAGLMRVWRELAASRQASAGLDDPPEAVLPFDRPGARPDVQGTAGMPVHDVPPR